MFLENFREKLRKLIIGKKNIIVNRDKIGEEVSYLCNNCDNTTFMVISFSTMKCVRCGYEENLL